MLDKANTVLNDITDKRLCDLADWLMHIHNYVRDQPDMARAISDVRLCLLELMADRAALQYMAEFERKRSAA